MKNIISIVLLSNLLFSQNEIADYAESIEQIEKEDEEAIVDYNEAELVLEDEKLFVAYSFCNS